ncbi:unnamed protein product [Trifolium pratense]|uniref:Uncharacterized protein n=1 Tax=Trifolium pratense TaxID=57577 RepID=A0ACB0JN07_TRIPR|nr:unnamed protein product [Trifolium pratense]
MIGYVGNLAKLGFPLGDGLATDLILQSLPESFNQFVLNFTMSDMEKTLPQLLKMLRQAEQNMRSKGKSNQVLMIGNGNHKKGNKGKGGKGKGKEVAKPKPNPKALKPTGGIAKEGKCFHCNKTRHWKWNCPNYLEDKKNGIESCNSAGIFVIEINLSTSSTWVLDTGCGSHICTNVQGLQKSRDLAKGEVDLRVGNGARVAALAVGVFNLTLPYGLIIQSCLLGKMTKTPFTGKGERASDLLALIHTDVCGSLNTHAGGGFQYFITFTDDYSRYGYVYLMKHKSESFEKFKEFKNEVQNHLGKKIKTLRSDRGSEYFSLEFHDHLKECGILSQLTPPGTPQWNGVSERRNRTLLDMVRSMMSHADLPNSFWGHALLTAAYTLNRVPSKTCFFVGYPKETKGYHFYNPSEGKVFVARTGVFLENDFVSKGISGRKVDLEEIHDPQSNDTPMEEQEQDAQDVVTENPAHVTQEPRRSNRIRQEPERYRYLISEQGDVLLMDQDEPVTYQEAITGPESEKWLEAMKSEMDSMYTNQVWNLVEAPDGVKPIGCKWVFKKKTDIDGKVQTYKARLVAKGFKQIHGVDYDETFSPVAMIKSIQILLAIAAYYDYEIWQMDVKTAFLNGSLLEDVYMTQPEGFCIPDDILLIGNDIPTLQQVKTWLGDCFSMKDLGETAYILGIRIYRDRSQKLLGLSQSTYIDKVMRRFNMHDSKKGFIPMQHGLCLSKTQSPSSKEERDRMSKIAYASSIGSIMYAMICTRPDVLYALSATSRYQSDPGEAHWVAIKNILKYLRRTKD